MGKRALIFGINGFVGGYLSRELTACGYEVFGTDLQESCRYLDVRDYRQCDICNAGSVDAVICKYNPDYVVNLAAISSVAYSWKEPALTMRVNVEGTINLLEAASKLDKSPRILLVGSSEEYAPSNKPLKESDPIDASNPYGISKVTQERISRLYLERYGLEICLTRSFNHTGPGQSHTYVLSSWCKQIAEIEKSGRAGVVYVGNIDLIRDFLDVRDVVQAYRCILENGNIGEVYNVGSGIPRSLKEILGVILKLANQNVEVLREDRLIRIKESAYICCDINKTKRELNWESSIPLEVTLSEMYKSYFRDCKLI